ncbi:MAG: hypothetical protein IIT64_10535 [Bacteroidaceae bacterium]|nr:hypothetical protein [Bacteroidaceae bacterium]
MSIDWNTIILTVVTVLFSWETFNNIKYRKENKKLKQNEVKTSDAETAKQQIDLVVYFKEQTLTMLQQIQDMQAKGNDNQSTMMEDMKQLKIQNERQDALLTDIVTYLNGDFQRYINEKQNTMHSRYGDITHEE